MSRTPDPSPQSRAPDTEPPAAAGAIFGDQLPRAVAYAALLATDGVAHGHLGPREVSRLWDRHLINSALLTNLVPTGARVVDVGSGAGLPGLPMAIRRADLHLDLVEPMLRRARFLTAAVSELKLTERIRVVRGRADDTAVVELAGGADWVVARAVAPLDRLVRWCLPLLVPSGRLLALKGSTAQSEVDEHAATVRRLGGRSITVERLGAEWGASETWVVSVQREQNDDWRSRRRRGR